MVSDLAMDERKAAFDAESKIAKRLLALIPELNRYYPPGWRDFRDPLPIDWRSGLYINIPQPTATPDGVLRIKALYGGAAGAGRAAEQLAQVTGKSVEVEPPHTEILEEDEGDVRIRVPYWTIRLIIPLSEVTW